MKQKIIFFATIVTMMLLVCRAQADINVEPMVIDTAGVTKAKQSRADLKVYNLDKKNKAYVEITPFLVEHPGKQDEKDTSYKNIKKLGIFTSPKKLIIPAGGYSVVRIGFLNKPGEEDRVFRIRVTPRESWSEEKSDKMSAGVKILVAYGALVFQRPAVMRPHLTMQRKGKTLIIKNTGNTNIELVDAKQCDEKKQCVDLEKTRRLYAGQTWQFTLPKAAPVRFLQIIGNDYKEIESQ